MLTPERLGRLALGSIAAIVGGLVLQGICADPSRAIAVWLLYVIVVACALNSREGEPLWVLARLAALPAIVPLIVLSYPALFSDGAACISGVRLTGKAVGFITEFCIFFSVISWIAIMLFAFARNALLGVFDHVTNPRFAERLKAAEAAVKAAVLLTGSLGLLYMAITGR